MWLRVKTFVIVTDTLYLQLQLQDSIASSALCKSKQCWLTSRGSPVSSRAANPPPAEKRLGEVHDGGGDHVLVVLEDAQAAHVLAPCSSGAARRDAGKAT